MVNTYIWHAMETRRSAAVSRDRAGLLDCGGTAMLADWPAAEVLFLHYVAGSGQRQPADGGGRRSNHRQTADLGHVAGASGMVRNVCATYQNAWRLLHVDSACAAPAMTETSLSPFGN